MKIKNTSLNTQERKERADSARSKLQSVGITLTYMSGFWASKTPITPEDVHESVKATNPDFLTTTYPATGTKIFDLISGSIRVTIGIDRDKFILQQGFYKEELDTIDYTVLQKSLDLITNTIQAAQ